MFFLYLLVNVFIIFIIIFLIKRNLSFSYGKSNLILREILKVAYTSEVVEEAGLKIIGILSKYFNYNYCTLFKYNESRNQLVIISTTVDFHNRKDLMDMAESIYKQNVHRSDAYIETSNVVLNYTSTIKRNIRYLYFIPLSINNISLGALLIERINPVDNKKRDLETDFFRTVTETITLALQNLIYFENVTNSAYLDGLTEVYNRKYMDVYLPKKIDYHKKSNIPFAIVIFDIDYFKKFNDTYGHQFGDLVLKELCYFVSENIRDEDVLFRYGGEEFVIFMPNVNEKIAFKRIDDIREKISELTLRDGNSTSANISCSFGVVVWSNNDICVEDLIGKADKALYISKNSGRNMVTVFDQ